MKDKESLQKIYFKKEHKNKWLGEEIKWLQRKKQQTDGSLEQRYRKCKLIHTKQLQGDTKLLRDIKRLQRHSKGSKKPSEQTSKQPEADTKQPEKTPSLQRCSLKWQRQRHTDEQKMMKMSRRQKKCLQTDMKQLQGQSITFTRLSDLTFDLDIRVCDTLSEVFNRCTYGINLKVLGDFQKTWPLNIRSISKKSTSSLNSA